MSGASTRMRLLAAARDLIAAGGGRLPSAGAVAGRAGMSRLTVYHHFGSHAGLFAAVAAEASALPPGEVPAPPRERLRRLLAVTCEHWAANPALFRRLPAAAEPHSEERIRALAVALTDADQLRPGCSMREAEDVIGLVTSFTAFDRLHHDGRRSPAAVAEILMRLAATVLNDPA